MSLFERFVPAATCVLCSVIAGYSQPAASTLEAQPAPQPLPSWEEVLKNSPILGPLLSWIEPKIEPSAEQQLKAAAAEKPKAVGSCRVTPLDPITDPASQRLESATGTDVVDLTDMVPAAAHALNLFEAKVASVGGTMVLKSAYRPEAYQQHLQNVWYKWMDLKNNQDPGCQDLRAEVQQEFLRHRLIETQHPVTVSDHTRGLAFDATVNLPTNAKIGRRLTLDGLARLAGFLRPAIASDPVHFKFLAGLMPQSSRPAGVRMASLRRRRRTDA